MTSVTAQGFVRTRLDERFQALVSSMQEIFQLDINIEPDSIDGQTLGIFAEAISNLDMLAEVIYQSFNPQTSMGVALSRLVQFNGIRRLSGTFSQVLVTVTGQVGAIIPAGSLVQSTGNINFSIQAEVEIPLSGTASVMALATETGPKSAAAGTVTRIATPIFGWQSVTNDQDAIPGRLEETDEQLRIRRRASTSTPGQAVLDSIYGALANLPGVVQAMVLENFTGSVDANGLPDHSIYAVVNGGDDQQIVDTLWLKRTAGATMFGNLSGIATDSQGNPHPVHYARPGPVPVYVVINLTTRPGWPTDGADRMKQALVDWAFVEQKIGEEVIQSRLFCPLNEVPGHSISSLYIGIAPGPTTSDNIATPFDGLATFDTSRITVNIL